MLVTGHWIQTGTFWRHVNLASLVHSGWEIKTLSSTIYLAVRVDAERLKCHHPRTPSRLFQVGDTYAIDRASQFYLLRSLVDKGTDNPTLT